MSHLGGFSEEALLLFQLAASEQGYDFSEGGDTYDFARCVRPDGTAYGTSGKCRKGSEEAKPVSEKGEGGRGKPSAGRSVAAKRVVSRLEQQKITDEKERLQKLVARGDKEAMEKLRKMREEGKIGKEPGFAPGQKARNEAKETANVKAGKSPTADVKPARKPRATAGELQREQQKLGNVAKEKRAAARAAEKAHKALEKELKNDRRNPENRKRLLETGRAWDKAVTTAERAERAWNKAYDRWAKASEAQKPKERG